MTKPGQKLYNKLVKLSGASYILTNFEYKAMQSPETEIEISKSAEIWLKKIVKLSQLIFGGFW